METNALRYNEKTATSLHDLFADYITLTRKLRKCTRPVDQLQVIHDLKIIQHHIDVKLAEAAEK